MGPALTWTLLAASVVIGLAGLGRMLGPAPEGGDEVRGLILLPEAVTGTIVTLFALAVVVFVVDLARRLRLRHREEPDSAPDLAPPPAPPWVRAITNVASLLYFTAIAYLLWRHGVPFSGAILGRGAGSATAPTLPELAPAPPVITFTFGLLGIVAGLGALALALWVAFSDRVVRWWQEAPGEPPATPLAEAVEDSLEDVRTEPDARQAIIRCYGRFERVAADSGFARKPWLTPMEFMREALERWPLPRRAVPTLTGLFELAQFSHRALGPVERDRALDALDEIKAALEQDRGGAVAS
jgi:hypothetical protein